MGACDNGQRILLLEQRILVQPQVYSTDFRVYFGAACSVGDAAAGAGAAAGSGAAVAVAGGSEAEGSSDSDSGSGSGSDSSESAPTTPSTSLTLGFSALFSWFVLKVRAG